MRVLNVNRPGPRALTISFSSTNSPVTRLNSPRSSLSSSMMPTAIGSLDSAALYWPVLRMVGRTSSVTHLRNGSEAGAWPRSSIAYSSDSVKITVLERRRRP